MELYSMYKHNIKNSLPVNAGHIPILYKVLYSPINLAYKLLSFQKQQIQHSARPLPQNWENTAGTKWYRVYQSSVSIRQETEKFQNVYFLIFNNKNKIIFHQTKYIKRKSIYFNFSPIFI